MPEYRVDANITNERGEVVGRVATVITLTAVPANAPPQYTGPSVINDLVVGQGRALQGFDPDGDVIRWSIDPADAARASVSADGVLVALEPLANVAVTVWLDDGKA